MEHGDLYGVLTHFWWLIFPVVWMVAVFARIAVRHQESKRILDMIKTFTDQGKEPPAALMEMFRAPGWRGSRYVEPYYTHRLWRRTFLFGFLAVAFFVAASWRDGDGPLELPRHAHFGMIIPAVVMAALCASNLAALLMRPKLPPDQK